MLGSNTNLLYFMLINVDEMNLAKDKDKIDAGGFF